MAARSSLLRRPTPGARPTRRTSSVVTALAALAPRLVRLAHHDYPDGLLVEQALGDRRVSVDAAVAEEGPVTPHLLLVGEVALDDEEVLGGARGFGEHHAEGIAHERRAPELEAAVGRALVPDAVHGRHVDAVGDRVRALHGLPGGHLRLAVVGLLARVPADGGRVEEDVGA